ncbi:type I restriction enzyme HsdR N-terminal domain-containing protein [Aegicerativicinus sediminis]|uniref:type I restriction enzyme HsdR N-terminal domain-containing protein n=1 Tax=Aegicerativicinus sediminis TaxID=2893202 RepID=UPI001E5281AD|nr:type I restriction enzyme HsdR N-terminal domain-containing protein [Aegicerativicinus sediminis]
MENNTGIFDQVRKKFVLIQPEEWVRQHCIKYLVENKGFPISLMNVEKSFKVSGLTKRYDLVSFKPDGSVFLNVECKAPNINITQDTFDQIARYNLTLKSDYLMVTNGLQHYICKLDLENETYHFLKDVPNYPDINE